ncbi:hypothetical protein K439DRAFT_1637936 [Ramaria rubella]|nr:hypothetical protein K439DRAFT_1637936 [Ramaria rubella]
MANSNVRPPPMPLSRPRAPNLKRGGSGSLALTNTLDPSLYPTTPPQTTYKSHVPEIGGSEGGFIGLIVGFAVLIILCCVAVFYLLHTRPHGGRSGNKNHPRSGASFLTSRRKKAAGWVQQGDEFDYDSEDDISGVAETGMRYDEGGSGYTPMQEPKSKRETDAYTDPFDPARLPESVRRQQVPLPALAIPNPPISARTTSPESRPIVQVRGSLDETKASPTTPTFEGGTKFKEQF